MVTYGRKAKKDHKAVELMYFVCLVFTVTNWSLMHTPLRRKVIDRWIKNG